MTLLQPVICSTLFYLHEDAALTPKEVRVRLCWDPYDPVAVSLAFQAVTPVGRDAVWCFARSLLTTGLLTPTGCGDVQVFPAVDGWLRIVLDSPSGRTEFTTASAPIEDWLRVSYFCCPTGAEYAGFDYDGALVALLEGECAA